MAAFKSRSITFPQLHTITRLLSFISWISPRSPNLLLYAYGRAQRAQRGGYKSLSGNPPRWHRGLFIHEGRAQVRRCPAPQCAPRRARRQIYMRLSASSADKSSKSSSDAVVPPAKAAPSRTNCTPSSVAFTRLP